MGFIAQDMEAVLPELVHTDQAGFKYVAYSKVVPLLVEGVKELWSKVDFLEQTGRNSEKEPTKGSSLSSSMNGVGLFKRRGEEDVMELLMRLSELEQENSRLRQQVETQAERLKSIEKHLGL